MGGFQIEPSASLRSRSAPRAASRLAVMLFCSTSLLLVGSACATKPVDPIDADAPLELAPTEGFVILHVDTEVPLARLVLSRRTVARSLGKGRHAWIVRLPEGRYRWTQVEVRGSKRYGSRLALDAEDELRFEVKAGAINYPGELSVRSDSWPRHSSDSLSVRNRNHSAMAVREIRDTYASILDAYPLRYAGSVEDGFLEYYTRWRREHPADESGGAGLVGAATTASEAP